MTLTVLRDELVPLQGIWFVIMIEIDLLNVILVQDTGYQFFRFSIFYDERPSSCVDLFLKIVYRIMEKRHSRIILVLQTGQDMFIKDEATNDRKTAGQRPIQSVIVLYPEIPPKPEKSISLICHDGKMAIRSQMFIYDRPKGTEASTFVKN